MKVPISTNAAMSESTPLKVKTATRLYTIEPDGGGGEGSDSGF